MRKIRIGSIAAVLMLPAIAGLAGCGHNVTPICRSNCPPATHEVLYAGSAGTIETLDVDSATGSLGTSVSTPGPQAPGGMVVDPAKKFLFVADTNNPAIAVFSIGASNGTLTPATTFTCDSSCGCATQAIACFVLNLAMAPNGQFLYAIQANRYSSFCCFSNIIALSVNSTTGALTWVGSIPAGFRPAQMAIDPAGKHLYAPDPGDALGSIYSFNIDPTSGALTPIPNSPFNSAGAGGTSPIGAVVHPSGKYLYTALFYGFVIQPYSINPDTGELSPIASSTITGDNLSLLVMDPQGKFLYSANDFTIDAFTLDPDTGVATQVAGNPFNAPNTSLGTVLDPSGNFLYSADYVSSIRTFSVNRTTGALSQVGPPASAGNSPLFLAIAK